MANEYFQPGSVPAPNAPGSSAVMRQEFASIAAGFDKLPIMAGHPGEIVAVDGTGTKLITTGAVVGDYVTKDGVFTLTNKTIAWADNIWPGFGDAATRNAGKMAGQVLLLENNMQLPAIDGSLLTGLNAGMVSGVVQILQGGTGASDVAGAQAALGIDLKAPIFNPVFTGAPSAPTPPTGDTSSRLATTWFVTNTINAIGAVTAGSDLPLMDGVASAGNLSLFAASRQDHVHPSDTSRAPASAATAAGTSFAPAGSIGATDVQAALQELDTEKAPLASPTFTGVPQAPTVADPSDTTDKIATTAWVQTRLVQIPVGVQLSNSNAQNLGTNPGPGVGVEASRWDHVHAFPIASQIPSVATGDVSATNVQAAIAELASEKSPVGHTHVAADVTNLSAALVPFTPTGTIAANNVQAAVAEVASEAVQKTSATGAALMPTGSTAQRPVGVAGHFRLNSEVGQWEGFNGAAWVAVGQGNAASTPFTPSGNIIATNVQAAIQELDTEKVPYTYLSATNTPFTPSGNIAANNVQAALQEVDTETQAGLATKVSKSGDTMTGALQVPQVAIGVGPSANTRLVVGGPSDLTGTKVRLDGSNGTLLLSCSGNGIIEVDGVGIAGGRLRIADNGDLSFGSAIAITGGDGGLDRPGVYHQYGEGNTKFRAWATGVVQQFYSSNNLLRGSITVSDSGTSFNTSSDYRLKENVEPLTDQLSRINMLRPVSFVWKFDGKAGEGFIAHELQSVFPNAVSGEKDGPEMQGIDTSNIVHALVAAVQELSTKLDSALAEIAALKAAK